MRNRTSIFQYSKEFESNIRDVFGIKGEEWLKDLPDLVAELENDWNFVTQKAIPHLTYSFVAAVTTKSSSAILKLSPVGARSQSEINWLKANPCGTPRILNCDPNRGAILMGHVIPGYSAKRLVQEGDDIAATKAIAQVIRNLQPDANYSHEFKSVSELSTSLECLRGRVDTKLLSKAEALFRDLTTHPTEHRLLHGDLHHDNVLFSGDQWLAIDPHGYVGPAAFEVGAMIRNPYDSFPQGRPLKETLETRIRVLKEELPFEIYEIQGWAFAYTLMSTGWSMADHGEVPKAHIEIAEALDEIVF